MKASKLIKNLQKLVEQYGDLDIVYSIDEEGNGFEEVQFDPSVGYFNEENRDWVDGASLEKGETVNSICIN